MADGSESETEAIDFAVAAYREEGIWQLHTLDQAKLESVDSIARELRRYPGDNGAIGLLSVDEDFFVIVRAGGAHVTVLLSDMGLMLDDLDLYPDEQLSDIASKLGFGPRFDELAGLGN